jgi:hypothetical protein
MMACRRVVHHSGTLFDFLLAAGDRHHGLTIDDSFNDTLPPGRTSVIRVGLPSTVTRTSAANG